MIRILSVAFYAELSKFLPNIALLLPFMEYTLIIKYFVFLSTVDNFVDTFFPFSEHLCFSSASHKFFFPLLTLLCVNVIIQIKYPFL